MAVSAAPPSSSHARPPGSTKRDHMNGTAANAEAARNAITIHVLLSVRRSLRTLVTAAPDKTPDARPATSPLVNCGVTPCMFSVRSVPATATARAAMVERPGRSPKSNHANTTAKRG